MLLSAERMDRIGRAGRAIARKRALQAILNGRTAAQLATLDALLAFDSAIRQTRFGWLGAWSDSPSAANLNGLLDRLDFLRGLAIDPACRETVHPERWKQIVREGDAAPAWLAEDFGADRRRATLLAYLIDLQERLTDEAIRMFCKQIGRLFARAAAACEERHKSSRKETTAALRLFRDTLRVLMEANTNNGDAIEMLHAKVGWRRLVEAQPSVEAMVAEKAVNPLPVAAQHHAGLRRYAPRFLAAFQFRASRRGDPMIAAIELLTQMPSAPTDQRTASAYIFGAICPKHGKGAALIMPRCNTEAMNLHLAEIAAQIAPGAHAALLVDQAGWHLSSRRVMPPNITLIPLPAKCPELNPQENVWQFMRDTWLSNRILQILRRRRRPLLRGLEQARRSTLADHVHRPSQLGPWVLINEFWYQSSRWIARRKRDDWMAYVDRVFRLRIFGRRLGGKRRAE